ncbi:LLM class flavin-dependent oxidoreductase [Geodermatophilus marinus]|uniref:LLM class flavin-dependent oxidoreductase n=1 Tax=Geodermatophilus sp. LHW52908 TaxID=2303986 RepID=UPI000E3D8479|nr:LLM class flavin-dependent oxidoreductase [Geodermatophilus sp. LHW52908]RFU21349.1 LLM class flavin-dependent oxidoreductase [Geodermatophilus sp. LHW52908]
MEIAIGMPNSIRGTTGGQLLDWARRAEAAGFSSLASIGAVSYPTYEELTVFAAAGAVTERIRFLSNVLIAPARSAAELAKQAATVHELTGGRLTLGLGVGWRASDYALTGRDHATRGALFDRQLADLRRAWAGEALAEGTRPPAPETGVGPVPVLIGGNTDAAIRRTVEHGVGWTAGGLPPEATAPFVDRVRAAWQDAGREGSPRIVALNYFGLGDTEERSRGYLLDYYAAMGDEAAQYIAGSAHRSPEAIREVIAGFEAIGVDELVLDPTVSDPDQVELLAEDALP